MPHVILNNLSHIRVGGAEAEHFLHNLVTSDIEGLAQGVWMPGALLTPQGKVLFAFLVARAEAGFVIEVLSQDAADLAKRLKFYRLRAKVDLSEPMPVAVAVSWDAAQPGAMKDGRFGQTHVWRQTVAATSGKNIEAWTRLCIEHGVAEPHADFDYSDVFPHDINLDQMGGVSFKKGCYVGQEVVSRMQHRGTARNRLMVASARLDLTTGAELRAVGKVVGTIGATVGALALALVRLDRVKDALDAGQDILAGGMPVTLGFPTGVSYGWPETGKPDA